MCKDCGCSIVGDVAIDGAQAPAHAPPHDHTHDHDHSHPHVHPHEHADPADGGRRTLPVHQAILDKNDRLAERNRGYFMAKGLLVLNVLSSPGSGKTTFLERTARDLAGRLRLGVIVGDLETDNDARRLRSSGLPAVQITTGSVCHLDAEMVARAMERLPLDDLDVLVIENVGNLVCPASYDLGESLRVVLLSVTEGEDKPLKYPVMFKTAHLIVVNKMDIAEAVGFDRDTALANIRRVAPGAEILEVSSRTGQGMDHWYAYLHDHSQRETGDHAPRSRSLGGS
ncbi:MAG TPA: hydrogenase nickel incorporation protein HypB [Candidatus Acidoferrum sp.]|nr:hydrogenase nickel incorporation protein HypB [Candidatus Acidoferrum sp.]